jgi:hypothetical protein
MIVKMCECGCGKLAPLAQKTNKKRGDIKNQPLRFIRGHNGKLRPSGIVEYQVDTTTGCWLWTRSVIPNGYGHLTVKGKQILAHRFVYEIYKGIIPLGLTLDHLCKNHRCVNPDHLEPVTQAENCRRGNRAKLNHRAVKEIKGLFNDGWDTSELSQKFGVERQTIASVVRGASWE